MNSRNGSKRICFGKILILVTREVWNINRNLTIYSDDYQFNILLIQLWKRTAMLKLFSTFSLDTRPMSLDDFNDIMDRHANDLPALLDSIHVNPPREGSPMDYASTAMAERLAPRLMPIAKDLVEQATGRTALGEFAIGATALRVIGQIFPANSIAESLQLAITHTAHRAVLRSEARMAGAAKQ